jgi:hypothetical protein
MLSTATATGAQVVSILMNQYDMRGAYATVLCAVNEQLKNFHVTGIIRDGRTDAELKFEEALEVITLFFLMILQSVTV